jgi:peptidase M50B-like protein
MDAASLRHLWHHLTSLLSEPGHQPSRTLVLVTGLLAVAAVTSRRVWPVSRTVVTMAHEGGHALVSLLTGRRLAGVRLFHNSAGVTVSAGYSRGPAIVLTALAGYLAPPLLGLGAAALLSAGHPLSVLLLGLAGLVGLAIAVRNPYGFLAVFAAGAVIVSVLWQGAWLAEAALGYAMAWFLLFGGARPVLELQRSRRRRPGGSTDADQLARLTGVPGSFWVGVFGLVALGALALGGWWLAG